MGYVLGVDLGTTFTAAAIFRDGRAEMCTLGSHGAAVPSIVLLDRDGGMVTGDAAERRALTEPERVVREFKRRVGDSVPVMVGGTPMSAEALLAAVLRDVVDAVTAGEGEAPSRVGVTHPANWGPYKLDLFDQAVRQAGVTGAVVVSEPKAAAVYYASREVVPVGTTVAVYDLGGGTFDAAVLHKTANGFEILGSPEGIERLGGIDFDAAVFAHVQAALGGAWDALDPDDPTTVIAAARLRDECVRAKEALSSIEVAEIAVFLPSVTTTLRLTRGEFEQAIRPTLAATVGALSRSVASAGLAPDDIDRILLIGGSSRIPLVAQLVTGEFARPVAVDAHPKHAVALGAATLAAAAHPAVTAPPPPAPTIDPAPNPAEAARDTPTATGATGARRHAPRKRRTALIAAVGGVALVAIVTALAFHKNPTHHQAGAPPPATTGSSLPGTTAVTNYLPLLSDGNPSPDITVTFRSNGSCATSNTTSRSDARHCTSTTPAPNGATSFDPCFVDSTADFLPQPVACPLDPTGRTAALLSVNDPGTPPPSTTPGTPPIWALTLANNARCITTSFPLVVGDTTYPFACDDNSVVTQPAGTGQLTVARLDQATNKTTTVDVTSALT